MRILLDEEDLDWDTAWNIVTNTFFFTNHTVLPVSGTLDRYVSFTNKFYDWL